MLSSNVEKLGLKKGDKDLKQLRLKDIGKWARQSAHISSQIRT